MKKIILNTLLCFALLAIAITSKTQTTIISSPSNNVKIYVNLRDGNLSYSVDYNGKNILKDSPIEFMFFQSAPIGKYLTVSEENWNPVNKTWEPVIGKHKTVVDHCTELSLKLKESRFPAREFRVIFRAYDDGIAFRYQFLSNAIKDNKMVLLDEKTTFNFTADHTVWAVDYGSYSSHQESEFWKKKLSDTKDNKVIGCPLVLKINDACYAAITEANLDNYPGMYLKYNGDYSIETDLAPRHTPDNSISNIKAYLPLPFKTPWRVMLLGQTPGELVESEIIMNLNEKCAIDDTSWIKPGMCAWDNWWSGDVKMDTTTQMKYIKLASDMGWPYQLIDWQWYGQFNRDDADVTTPAPGFDLQRVLEYAKENNVRCWLWLWWSDVERNMEEAFALYEKWGIAGVKIDFMARDDQEMVQWYEKTIKLAAKYHLLVNFHGAYKPTGIRRTYPNMMTREGVLGNEYSYWSTRITPEHNVTLPFTRMLCGQMDYTPGGFLNRAMGEYENTRPTQVMGTRCHQLAMFVVYDSPITTVCDHPDNYKDQPGTEFLKVVPTTYDDMKVLQGEIGEYIIMAKQKGDDWFLAGMTNSLERNVTVPLDFLDGKYDATIYKDADDSKTNAEHLIKEESSLSKKDILTLKMSPGGGFVIHFKK